MHDVYMLNLCKLQKPSKIVFTFGSIFICNTVCKYNGRFSPYLFFVLCHLIFYVLHAVPIHKFYDIVFLVLSIDAMPALNTEGVP